MLPQDVPSSVSAGGRTITQAWDPYDVWLKRVKLPRERQPPRATAVAGIPAAAAEDARSSGQSTDGPLLLPGVS